MGRRRDEPPRAARCPPSASLPSESSQPLWTPEDRPGRNSDDVERAAGNAVANLGTRTAPPFARTRLPRGTARRAANDPVARSSQTCISSSSLPRLRSERPSVPGWSTPHGPSKQRRDSMNVPTSQVTPVQTDPMSSFFVRLTASVHQRPAHDRTSGRLVQRMLGRRCLRPDDDLPRSAAAPSHPVAHGHSRMANERLRCRASPSKSGLVRQR